MFTFQPWSGLKIGDSQALANDFSSDYATIWPKHDDHPDIQFEIVDLRPGSYDPDQVHEIIECLAHLLQADAARIRSFSRNSRLLFVGSVRTLAMREEETNVKRSIKRDTEFYIRALQNYGLAHYAGIGAELDNHEGHGQAIRSALIGFWHHYSDPKNLPAKNQISVRLKQIRADFEALVTSAHRLPEFRYLGSLDSAKFLPGSTDHFGLLLEVGVIYQFGKGDRPEQYSPAKSFEDLSERKLLTFDVLLGHSSYKLYAKMLEQMGAWAEAFHAKAIENSKTDNIELDGGDLSEAADNIAKHSFKLSRYDLLRDFGRVLGQATLQKFREKGTAQPILLIDDELYGILEKQSGVPRYLDEMEDPIVRLLGYALSTVGRNEDNVRVVPSSYIDAHLGMMQADGLSKLLNLDASVKPLDLSGKQIELCSGLDNYLAILIDPESRHDPCGPVRVQRLHSFLRYCLVPFDRDLLEEAERPAMPPLLAYSRKESSGYVQQCLNMGASAFVPKTRPYQLLFALSRALRDERRQLRPREQASQFRILKTLKPHVSAKLLRKSGPSFIHGGLALPSGTHLEDAREARWIRNLPKADLHYHLGTAIPCPMVNVLAMNTAGHFLTGAPDAIGDDSGEGGASPLLRRLADTLALTARLERKFLSISPSVSFPRMELLAAAAAAMQPAKSLANSPFGLGDAIVRHLLEANDKCDDAHATALLVAMMASHDSFGLGKQLDNFFKTLIRLSLSGERSGKEQISFESDPALAFEMERAQEHFHRVACRWNGTCTKDDFEALATVPQHAFWIKLRELIEDRIGGASIRLRKCLDKALDRVESNDKDFQYALSWLSMNSSLLYNYDSDEPCSPIKRTFSLEDYVAVPEVGSGRGLQLYLRGADLLGSSHLQYPENLWMAALAITQDNADENIIYSEVRCETTGFCKAGMGAHDATEILRHGFNLASLYIARRRLPGHGRPSPLVRTNILLAAKRHKTEREARAVVNLLEVYLERRAAVVDAARSRRAYASRFGRTIPPWWRPCDVVGFDLSGDEARDKDWLKGVISPLAARSSPVTIHAGEAASAESIWRAVYELNALRIGHGLRLNEDNALLGYCVREGICMEFCPNSNRYTNQLQPQKRRDIDEKESVTPYRYEYPLIHYLSQGMEVTLGTDNRYLHRRRQRTLTSEYLTAAELVGGLTRWEVLQIVKAGFKNAFLDKAEVQTVLESVEEEIYRIVATDF